MNADFLVLAGRVRQEISDLTLVIARAERAGRVARNTGEDADLYVDAAALNLHDFYSGLERVFRQIAAVVDRSVPSGAEWHRDLLQQMCIEIPGLRPAVLSTDTCIALEEFMRFRHVVRNVYAYQLDGERVQKLVHDGRTLLNHITAELQKFTTFIEQAGE